MMANRSGGRRGLLWAAVGGLVLVAGIVAIIVSALVTQSSTPTPTADGDVGTPRPTSSAAPPDDVVDPTALTNGWTPEPLTTDREVYIRAALEAASTFDTQKSTREDWLDYLDTWFTPDTRYTSSADQQSSVDDAQVELRTGVVLPEQEWDSLASENGRVIAVATGDIAYVPVSDDSSGDMSIGTSDLVLTFTRVDGSGGETSYDEQVRVSVQVLCGPASVPTPGTAQQPGDCKV
ncbi:hypothetical protein ACWGR3_31275, partial [Streptomyces albidoflavus]